MCVRLILRRIDKAAIGNGSDAHLGRLGRSDTRKRILDHKAGVYLIFAKIFSISSPRKARMV